MARERALHPNPHLRQQRELRGWSLQEMADRLNQLCERDNKSGAVNLYMVNKWERGVHTPSPFYRAKLCELFGLTTVQLGFLKVGPVEEGARAEERADTQRQDERFQASIFSGTSILPAQIDSGAPESPVSRRRLAHPSLSPMLTPAQSGRETGNLENTMVSTDSPFSSLFGTDGRFESMLEVLRMPVEEGDGAQDLSQLPHRQFLELGIAAFITRLAQLDRKRISAVEREELGRALSESIIDGWRLFHTAGNTEVFVIGQVQLSLIHQAHALLPLSIRSHLYTGAYGLVGVSLHLQKRGQEALHAYHYAHLAAMATGNSWTIAQNLIAQADTYLMLDHFAEAFQALEEALSYIGKSDEEHRRSRAHLLGCWADVAMTMKDYTLAQHKLEEATDYLDHGHLNEEFDRICWLQLRGKKAIMESHYVEAVSYLEEAVSINPAHWLVRQTSLLLLLGIAYARLHEREKSLQIAHQALPVLRAFNAPMTNQYFVAYLQDDVLGRFSHDDHLRAFLTDVQHQLPHIASLVDLS